MSDSRREVVFTERWIPVTEPRLCSCGHTHSGRQNENAGGFFPVYAPQWKWCDKEGCTCGGFRPADWKPNQTIFTDVDLRATR